jgi:alpha-D-ribose 1-methylphosphonate 5-triphosphate synthase subunit PhnL
MNDQRLRVIDLEKGFTLHNQGGVRLPVLRGIDLAVAAGECVVLKGPSGTGKSTLLRTLYGNYLIEKGHVLVRHDERVVDLATAPPRLILEMRRRTMGFVSQFLRVIPRVPTIDIVAEPLRSLGIAAQAARQRAGALLERLAIPQRLWSLPPATFSGGEQQRVNVARGLIAEQPIILLDEPTAALDDRNRAVVMALIDEVRRHGSAIVGIFHDVEVRDTLGTRIFDLPNAESA